MSAWPDPSRLGVPLNPERDGWHWVLVAHGIGHPFPMMWAADGMMWDAGDAGWTHAEDIATRWRYLGPCLTPAEVAAAVQAERDEIARDFDDARVMVAGTEVARSIRARGPADALAEALAQARREGMEEERKAWAVMWARHRNPVAFSEAMQKHIAIRSAAAGGEGT